MVTKKKSEARRERDRVREARGTDAVLGSVGAEDAVERLWANACYDAEQMGYIIETLIDELDGRNADGTMKMSGPPKGANRSAIIREAVAVQGARSKSLQLALKAQDNHDKQNMSKMPARVKFEFADGVKACAEASTAEEAAVIMAEYHAALDAARAEQSGPALH